jgi:hypothetical protein
MPAAMAAYWRDSSLTSAYLPRAAGVADGEDYEEDYDQQDHRDDDRLHPSKGRRYQWAKKLNSVRQEVRIA